MKHRQTVLIAALMAGAAACGGGSSYSTGPGGGNPPPANTVDATNSLTFDPSSLTVSSGTAVTFAFAGVQHTVTFTPMTGAPADIPLSSNTSVSRTFSTPGTYPYHCTIHSQMTGTIVVQ